MRHLADPAQISSRRGQNLIHISNGAKGRVAYQRRKRNKLVEAEVDQYVLDRYGAGWVEQEG